MNSQPEHPFTLALSEVIRGMCAYPDLCDIKESSTKDLSLDLIITISPHMADYRVICGKGGRQIKAIQFLAKAASRQFDFIVKLVESFRGRDEDVRPFNQDPSFDTEKTMAVLKRLASFVFEVEPQIGHERQNDKLMVWIGAGDSPAVVSALSDLFYPYGFRKGCIVDIRPLRQNESNPVGVRKVLGNKRVGQAAVPDRPA